LQFFVKFSVGFNFNWLISTLKLLLAIRGAEVGRKSKRADSLRIAITCG